LKHIEKSKLRLAYKDFNVPCSNSANKDHVFSLYDSDGELDILTLNHFCGEVTETLSDGDASDLCDLQAIIPRKKRSSSQKKKKCTKKIKLLNERDLWELQWVRRPE
jgi:hypothetical protein